MLFSFIIQSHLSCMYDICLETLRGHCVEIMSSLTNGSLHKLPNGYCSVVDSPSRSNVSVNKKSSEEIKEFCSLLWASVASNYELNSEDNNSTFKSPASINIPKTSGKCLGRIVANSTSKNQSACSSLKSFTSAEKSYRYVSILEQPKDISLVNNSNNNINQSIIRIFPKRFAGHGHKQCDASSASSSNSTVNLKCQTDSRKVLHVKLDWFCAINEDQLILFILENGENEIGIWSKSNPIIERINCFTVSSCSTIYSLEGPFKVPESFDIPDYIVTKFRNGFPEDWLNIRTAWINYKNKGKPENFEWEHKFSETSYKVNNDAELLQETHIDNRRNAQISKKLSKENSGLNLSKTIIPTDKVDQNNICEKSHDNVSETPTRKLFSSIHLKNRLSYSANKTLTDNVHLSKENLQQTKNNITESNSNLMQNVDKAREIPESLQSSLVIESVPGKPIFGRSSISCQLKETSPLNYISSKNCILDDKQVFGDHSNLNGEDIHKDTDFNTLLRNGGRNIKENSLSIRRNNDLSDANEHLPCVAEGTSQPDLPLNNSVEKIFILEKWTPNFQPPNLLCFSGSSKTNKKKMHSVPLKQRLAKNVILCQDGYLYKLQGVLFDPEESVPKEIKHKLRRGIPSEVNDIIKEWAEIISKEGSDKCLHNERQLPDSNIGSIRRSSRGRIILPPLQYWNNERHVDKKRELDYEIRVSNVTDKLSKKPLLVPDETIHSDHKNRNENKKTIVIKSKISASNHNQQDLINGIEDLDVSAAFESSKITIHSTPIVNFKRTTASLKNTPLEVVPEDFVENVGRTSKAYSVSGPSDDSKTTRRKIERLSGNISKKNVPRENVGSTKVQIDLIRHEAVEKQQPIVKPVKTFKSKETPAVTGRNKKVSKAERTSKSKSKAQSKKNVGSTKDQVNLLRHEAVAKQLPRVKPVKTFKSKKTSAVTARNKKVSKAERTSKSKSKPQSKKNKENKEILPPKSQIENNVRTDEMFALPTGAPKTVAQRKRLTEKMKDFKMDYVDPFSDSESELSNKNADLNDDFFCDDLISGIVTSKKRRLKNLGAVTPPTYYQAKTMRRSGASSPAESLHNLTPRKRGDDALKFLQRYLKPQRKRATYKVEETKKLPEPESQKMNGINTTAEGRKAYKLLIENKPLPDDFFNVQMNYEASDSSFDQSYMSNF